MSTAVLELKILTPKDALHIAFLNIKPNRTQFNYFKTNLIQLLDATNNIESEEFHKNLVANFLRKTYYDPDHFINTRNRADQVIHNGKTYETTVGVIIEAKKPTNRSEMMKVDKINVKAFHELILYYLRERITFNNLEIKHLIITNIKEWFIFDVILFEKLFAQNKSFVKQFKDFEARRSAGTDTPFFYEYIARPFISDITTEIKFTHFKLQDYEKALHKNDEKADKKLINIFKIFSPAHLLKLPIVNDSNNLDKGFYNELLHIIGLTEIKKDGKKLIKQYKKTKRNSGSLIEETIIQLDSLNKITKLKNPHQFGDTFEDRLFNVSLDLCITWINRILFLKLLEAQLINYNKGSKEYSFLNFETIKNYGDLNTLFFQVLAKKHSERNDDVKTLFEKIPYLNSSLFDQTEIEDDTIIISNLKDDKKIPIISSTVLKNDRGRKRTGKLCTLEYLFEFLNSYNFGSQNSEQIQDDNKTLINASVLGLIFEKINGYKDGSFFTPGFITMYMCRETIRKAVVQKFNEMKDWNCETINDLYNKIENRKEANNIVNSLKICDPAVGSGHFLVSALNEIISIKHDLKILVDRNGQRIKEYEFEVINDDLIIIDEGELFEYNRNIPESQRIQEMLFHEKKTIIENCLFGVDINTNSVKICCLRLWIELLKNAYYKNELELETLPNIDINIKCGNSLISRFSINADIDLKKVLKKKKWTISGYRKTVSEYRNAENRELKREMSDLIYSIKSELRKGFSVGDPEYKNLSKIEKLLNVAIEIPLFEQTKKEKTLQKIEIDDLTKQRNELKVIFDEYKSNEIFINAFEWRFEFPEVLNDNGEFIGFDLIIGNPPYIPGSDLSKLIRKNLKNKYHVIYGKYETSIVFIALGLDLLKPFGVLSYIAPVTWQTGANTQRLREMIINNYNLDKIINLPFNIFEDAYVDTAIYFIQNSRNLASYQICNLPKKKRILNLFDIEFDKINISRLTSPELKIILNPLVANIQERIASTDDFIPFGEITISTQGLSGNRYEITNIADDDDDVFPYLSSGNVYNFQLLKEEINFTSMKGKETLKSFYNETPKLLIRRLINRQDRLCICYCDERLVFKKDINPFIPIDDRFDCNYLLAILTSKLISYLYIWTSSIALKNDFRQTTLIDLKSLPIPILPVNEQGKFIEIVMQIMDLQDKNKKQEILILQEKMDEIVFDLYDLTDEEKMVILHTYPIKEL